MRKLRTILPIILTLLLITALPALAQEGTPNEAAGTAVVFGLLAVILFVIAVVAVLGAVGLGIIGLGYSSIQSDE